MEDLVVEDSSSAGKFALAQAKSSGKTLSFSSIKEIAASDEKERLRTEFDSLNEVLGGGILRGSVILFAGQPGIGKSTILMQICAKIANGHKVLYVSGEESAGQVEDASGEIRGELRNFKLCSFDFGQRHREDDFGRRI